MFDFLKKQEPVGPLSEPVRTALRERREVSEVTAAGLRMTHQKGLYSGRKVNYFRVFDPRTVQARRFGDLDGTGVLYSGHIEAEGHIVLNP